MRIFIFGLLATFFLAAMPVMATDYNDGVAYYKNKDYEQAFNAFSKAALEGDASSQYQLAEMYRLGHGVNHDYSQAFAWYEKAASQGHAASQTNLGVMYSEGVGAPKNYKLAFSWFNKAAEQGQFQAQINLGVMYAAARATPKDLVQAHKWFSLAARNGNALAAKDRQVAEQEMTAEQIAQAKKLAAEWISAHVYR